LTWDDSRNGAETITLPFVNVTGDISMYSSINVMLRATFSYTHHAHSVRCAV